MIDCSSCKFCVISENDYNNNTANNKMICTNGGMDNIEMEDGIFICRKYKYDREKFN